MIPLGTSVKHTVCILALLILASPNGYSQFISQDPFPAMPWKVTNAELYSADSSFIVFGEIGKNSTDIFDDWYGYSVPFLLPHGSRWPETPSFLADTNAFWSSGIQGYEDYPSYSVALDHNNRALICWSKLHLDLSDVPPTYLSNPVLRGALYSSGTMTDHFAADSALNPQVVFDSNNTAHMVWERVTPLDTLSQWWPGRFIKYSSEIVYTTRSSNGAMSSPIFLGKGFSPQIQIAPDNSVHILFFGADSSSSDRFQLLYVKGNGASLTSPKLLQTIPSTFSLRASYVKMSILGWSVDSSNTLHYAWPASSAWPNSKFYVLHCSDEAGIHIDSSGDYLDVAIKFLFKKSGEIDAGWLSRTTTNGATEFFFSASSNAQLFSQVKIFSSVNNAQSLSLFEDRMGKLDAVFPGAGKIQIMKDLLSGKDTVYSIPTDQTVGTSLFLDNKNELWLLGSKDSVYSLLHFPLDDVGRAPVFTLPLQEGTVWQYQSYMTEVSPAIPNGYVQIKLQKDTLLANEKCYTRVPFDMFHVLYLRNNGLRTYEYLPKDSSEFVCYDFSKKMGDTVAIFYNESGTSLIKCIDVEHWNLFGALHTVMSFRGEAPFVNEEVADSLGILGWGDGLATAYELIGAIVGGLKYGTVLSVGEKPQLQPIAFSLSQNYPNPFNPVTSFRFTISEAQIVTFKIYDVLGREVASLVHEKRNPGTYTVTWNASNYPSGVYFYRMRAGNFEETRKMVLVK